MTEIIDLNVGGSFFQVSRSTLLKFDGFFRRMCEFPAEHPKDKNGAIFIDRSAKHFEKVMNFLRYVNVPMPESPEDVKEIREEAEFYSLEGLVDLCNQKLRYQKKGLFWSDVDEMAKAISNSNKNVICSVFYPEADKEASVRIAMANHMKFGDNIDFFCTQQTDLAFREYHLSNKTNGEFFQDIALNRSLEEFIQMSIPDIFDL